MKKRYVVCFEQDESNAWIVWVPSVQGCHTHGRSLRQARGRIREALSLFVSDAWTAELAERIKLPVSIRQAVRKGVTARSDAERVSAHAQRQLSRSARQLTRAGYSYRDTASLLGLSHQRIAQLVDDS